MKKSLFVSFLSKLAARYMIMGMTKVRCKDLSFHIKRVKSSVKIPNLTSSLSDAEDFFPILTRSHNRGMAPDSYVYL